MVAARQGERGEQALCSQRLQIRGCQGEVFESPLHLRACQGLVPEMAHGRADAFRGEQGAQHAPVPVPRADILFRPRSLPPGIDGGEDVLDEREVSPRAMEDRADEAQGRLSSRHDPLLRAGRVRPHDLVAGEPDLRRFLQGGPGHDALGAQDDPVGLGDLDPQPGRFLVESRRWHRQVLHRKAVVGGLAVEDGNGFPAKVAIEVDMDDFPALELVHAAGPLAEEPDLGRGLTPPVERRLEDIRKHPPIRGVRAPRGPRKQGDLILRGPLNQGIDERSIGQLKHCRSRGPLGFEVLVALEATGDVVDGLALFPD